MLAGQIATGFSLSVTVTVNVQLDELPEGSVAVAVTVVVPIGNELPEAGLKEIVALSLSVAVAV